MTRFGLNLDLIWKIRLIHFCVNFVMKISKTQCPDCQELVNFCPCPHCDFDICGQHEQLTRIEGVYTE